MASNTQLAHYLLKLEPQSHRARLAFYHFIKNCCELNQSVTAKTIERFYRSALAQAYWEEHGEELAQVVSNDLLGFAAQEKLGFDPEKISHADSMQVIHLKDTDQLFHLVTRENNAHLPSDTKLKVIKINSQRVMSLLLSQSGDLSVQVYSPKAILCRGKVFTVQPVTQIYYNRILELKGRYSQKVEVEVGRVAHFQIHDHHAEGFVVSGPTFQRSSQISGPLNESQELFFALKRIEHHFVKASSDPHYQDIRESLEKAISLLSERRPEGESWALSALKRAQIAYKNTFPNDKLLYVLITNLQFALNERHRDSHPPSLN